MISDKKTVSFDLLCYLISNEISIDDIGNETVISTETPCWCAELPITATEFYKAGLLDIRPNVTLKTLSENYLGQKKARFNDVTYTVYRIYEDNRGYVYLYLTEKVGDWCPKRLTLHKSL